jgi:hypothetical protein
LIAAANEDGQKSYTIKKRDELEKVAKTNRWFNKSYTQVQYIYNNI